MTRCKSIAALVLGLCAGCVPPEVMEEADSSEPAQFGPVADLVRGSCSNTASCHGSTSITNFVVEGDGQATDEQVRASLEDVETGEGAGLVVPGEPDQSALYLRLIETGPKRMPPVEALSDDQIEMVRTWIADGAHYE